MSNGLERELAEWHRKLTNAKNARKAKIQESERVLASQRGHIEDERKLGKHMQEQLCIDLESTLPGADAALQERKDKLQDLVETYSRKVEVESRQLESIQQELEITKAKALELRRETGGHHAAEDETKNAAKTIKLLENRLEQAEKRFGEAITGNKVLHRDIDEHNKARSSFEKVCFKLEQELATKQEHLDLLHTSVTVADEARAAAVRQLSTARAQEDREVQAYETEMRELQAQTKRLEGVVEAAEGGSPAARPALSSSMQAKDLTASGTRAEDSTASGTPEKDLTATTTEALSPDATVACLKQASGILDLGSMVNHFCRLESLNYHLFDACNQANVRIAALQKELQNAQADLEHLESTEMMSRHKEVTANTLTKRDQALKRAEALHDKQVLLERRLALVRAGMSQALRTLGTSLAPPARPEDSASVYAALLQNLGTLETKARAVLAVYSKIMDKNAPGSEDHAGGLARPSSVRSSASIGSHIPPAALPARPPSSLARPPSSITTKSPRVQGRPGLETGLSRASSSSNEDSDGSPAVPLSREQLQAQLHAQN